ncbi:MAG: heavy metal-associated domain-containing protein [Bacilli bacterium]|nr:heavy metal-associated domain-containing protein [Bacilli bacterium]
MFWNNKKKIVNISGMSCEKCAKKVKNALESIPEINKVKVDLSKNAALIYYKTEVNDEDIRRKIEEFDYKITGIRNIN